MSPDTKKDIISRNREHQEFLEEAYRKQMKEGGYFIHETAEGIACETKGRGMNMTGEEGVVKIKTGEWSTGGGGKGD